MKKTCANCNWCADTETGGMFCTHPKILEHTHDEEPGCKHFVHEPDWVKWKAIRNEIKFKSK